MCISTAFESIDEFLDNMRHITYNENKILAIHWMGKAYLIRGRQ
jgi:hypothetical protein